MDNEYDLTESRRELLIRVAPYKSREKLQQLDQIADEVGHLIIRLPPCHCQCKPLEVIWAYVKGEVALLGNSFSVRY
jgi:hypothetical protein